jgi:hypothetical protein
MKFLDYWLEFLLKVTFNESKQFVITTIEVGYGFYTLLENALCFKLLIFLLEPKCHWFAKRLTKFGFFFKWK